MKFLTLNSVYGGEVDVHPFKIVTMKPLAGKNSGTRITFDFQNPTQAEDVVETREQIKKKLNEMFKISGE